MATGTIIYFLILCNIKSFGVPYLEPYIPTSGRIYKGIFLSPVWKRESREDFIDPKKKKKQGNISMKWRENKKIE